MKQIGYKTISGKYLLGYTDLKKDLLYFDQLIYDKQEILHFTNMFIKDSHGGRNGNAIKNLATISEDEKKLVENRLANLEYLKSKELIIEIDSKQLINSLKNEFKKSTDSSLEDNFLGFFENINHQSVINVIREREPELLNESWDWEGSYKNILMTYFLKIINFADAVPLLKNFDSKEFGINFPQNKDHQILEFILKEFPIIDDSVSYEQLIDFKSDENSRRKFFALRNWMIDISKGDYTINEIKEKYLHLYHEYKAHLELHKISTNVGILKSFAITTSEILGDLASFKWGKAVKTGFEIFDQKAKLIELEQNAPGKEVGYIYHSNKEFKR